MYDDHEGTSALLWALILKAIVFTVTGAAVGGVSSAVSGDDFGDVFMETCKGAFNGFLIAASIDLIIAEIATEGLGLFSTGGSAMVSYGISTLLNFIEVGVLQFMKSREEEKGFAKSLNNVNRALYANWTDIAFGRFQLNPLSTKTIPGTRLASKLLLMASYCAYYKAGVNSLAQKAPFLVNFLAYAIAAYNVFSCIRHISTRNYESGLVLY